MPLLTQVKFTLSSQVFLGSVEAEFGKKVLGILRKQSCPKVSTGRNRENVFLLEPSSCQHVFLDEWFEEGLTPT